LVLKKPWSKTWHRLRLQLQPARAQRIASHPCSAAHRPTHRIPCSVAHCANATSPRAAHCIANNPRTVQRAARTDNQPAAHRPPRTTHTSHLQLFFFAHRRNIYGAQILVDKAIITARHQIAYDVELFPFLQRDNSNDRMQFLQSLLKRKTAPISDSALDNDHLNSDATTPYPNSVAIDDSSDDEQVTNLMQDVDNLSKVPPFNILDSETRRSDVSLHVPPKANPNVDEEFTASPSQRRSSRHKRSSLSMDDSESLSSKPIAKRSKVIDKASTAKSLPVPIITSDTLRVNKSLLIGKKA
jgi:hypothetical protein